jgi:signal transduction histidine kinase
LQVFRIVQEALNNVEKHAEAAEAIVVLRYDSYGNLFAGVSDDGKGFEIPLENVHWQPANTTTHLGIRGMKERAAFLGGNLEIKTERGEGTFVRLQVPAVGGKK